MNVNCCIENPKASPSNTPILPVLALSGTLTTIVLPDRETYSETSVSLKNTFAFSPKPEALMVTSVPGRPSIGVKSVILIDADPNFLSSSL